MYLRKAARLRLSQAEHEEIVDHLARNPTAGQIIPGTGGARTFCDGSEADFFAGLNVTAIVLEVPSADLTAVSDTIGVWGRIRLDEIQVERMGIPVIATVLIPDGSEDALNLTIPADDVVS